MDHLTNDQKLQIKNQLEHELQTIRARISELKIQDPFAQPTRVDDNAALDGEASEESDHDRVSALVDELLSTKTIIEKTLASYEDGTYGICVSCGAPIDIKRLMALPTASQCLDCEAAK